MFSAEKIRGDFPILKKKVHGHPLVYLDNAAMTQKPRQVIEALVAFYENYCSNVGRSVHSLAEEATNAYEGARETIARFINSDPREVVFTRNTTESINLIAYSLSQDWKKGDGVVSSVLEHHSNIVPWQLLRDRAGIRLDFAGINDDATLRTGEYDKLLSKNTKLVTLTHVSNVTGTINDVQAVGKLAHDNGSLFLVDGAQSAPHFPVDVRKLGCDFFAFSGYKMLAPTGIGILYARRGLLEKMQPFLGGGDMIKEVHLEHTIYNEIPHKFEAGTPNIGGAVGLEAAIKYLQKIGMKNVREHEKKLTEYGIGRLSKVDGLKLYGPQDLEKRGGVLTFSIHAGKTEIHPHDVATLLDQYGIAVRSGHACAQPLVRALGENAITRATPYIYNTSKEIGYLADCLEKVKKVFS
ncbi:cysteine desulfurase [archaeon]|nr:cysteine desulfurase [archaeon]